MPRPTQIPGFTSLLLLALATSCTPSPEPPPDIILVVVDTLRRDHVGTYGYERDTTPNLDRRAQKGLVFDRCVSQAPWTAASMASMFTSRLPGAAGVTAIEDSTGRRDILANSCSALPLEATTVAEVLQEAGYRTAAVTTNPFLTPQFGLVQGFGEHRRGQLTAKDVVDSALTWFDDSGRQEGERPLFLYLHFMDVHAPNRPRGKFVTMFPTVDGQGHRREHSRGGNVSRTNTPPAELRVFESHKLALYDGCIAFVDEQLERLFAHLESTGRLESAVVIFTADHGEELWDRDRAGHGLSMHHSETDIPLILFGAGIPADRVDRLVRGLDVAPTILDVAGVQAPPSFVGVSLLELARSRAPLAGVSEDIAYGHEQKALELEGWKVVVDRQGAPLELYDRTADPRETNDLVQVEAGRAAALAEQLAGIIEASARLDQAGLEIDEQTKEQLRSLGY